MSKEAIYESCSDVPDYIYLEHEYIDKTWISRAHYHNSIEFSACLSGTHRVCINGTMYAIEAGEIACINSFDVHYFDIRKGTEVVPILIGKQYLEDLQKVSGKEDISFPAIMQNKTKNARAIEILMQWSEHKADCGKLHHKGYADLFLGELYKQYGLAERKWSEANRAVIDILQYIQHNLGATLTLDDASYRMGYSKNHFAKLFRDAVGQTFREYVSTQRVERAKDLIERDTSRTIVDIAFTCGFDSMATFYRAYMKRYGELPRKGGGVTFYRFFAIFYLVYMTNCVIFR